MSKSQVKLTICGTDYNVLSDDNEEYITEVGQKVDKRITEVLNANSKFSVTMAAILVTLEFCDTINKNEKTIQYLKTKDSSTEKDRELDKSKFEIEVLKEKIIELQNTIETLSKENEQTLEKLNDIRTVRKSEDVLNFFDIQNSDQESF